MRGISFPYAKHGDVYRPVIPIKLFSQKRVVSFDALVDSGADQTTLPGAIAKALGFNVAAGKKRIFSGIGGSVLTHLHRTNIEVAGIRFSLDVFYSHQWDDMPFGLLGQNGFFSRFDGITFDYKRKTLTLEYDDSH